MLRHALIVRAEFCCSLRPVRSINKLHRKGRGGKARTPRGFPRVSSAARWLRLEHDEEALAPVNTSERGFGTVRCLTPWAHGSPGGGRTYRLRATSVEPGQTGAWRLEVMHNGQIDRVFPGEDAPFPVRSGCSPLPPIVLQAR